VRGLVFLDPRRQETNAPAPKILLEELLVNGQPQQAEPASPGGLENMKSRLAECGGRVKFFSAPAQGTEIKFIFPLPKTG
jgi:hypothetical protein